MYYYRVWQSSRPDQKQDIHIIVQDMAVVAMVVDIVADMVVAFPPHMEEAAMAVVSVVD